MLVITYILDTPLKNIQGSFNTEKIYIHILVL